MTTLLRGDFLRFRKMKVVWYTLFGMIAMVIVMLLSSFLNEAPLTTEPFQYLMYLGIIMAAPIGMFISSDYTNGTIRNKIIVGHNRSAVYMSKLLLCCSYALVVHVLCETVQFGVGIPLLGLENASGKAITVNLILTVFIVWVYASLSVFVAMTVKSATGMVASFLLNYALMMVSMLVIEFPDSDVMKTIAEILPTAQIMVFNSYETATRPFLIIVISIVMIGLTTFGGLKIFKETDLI